MTPAQHDHNEATRRQLVMFAKVLFLAVVVIPAAMWAASLG